MFRSLFQDHLQGSSFALSAPTTLQLHALLFVCIGMLSYALCLYVYPVYLPVCCLVVLCTTRQHTGKSEGRPLKMVLEWGPKHVGSLFIYDAFIEHF
jgi:hypothetical protein